jgi:hypothetical protein
MNKVKANKGGQISFGNESPNFQGNGNTYGDESPNFQGNGNTYRSNKNVRVKLFLGGFFSGIVASLIAALIYKWIFN